MEQRILFLTDFHVPYNIPLDPIFQFTKDFKPTTLILGGDVHDWTSVSMWIADQSRALDGGTIEQNYEQMKNVVLDPLYRAIGKDCGVVFLTGNHEDWLSQAARLNPNGRGFWELENNLADYEMSIRPINVPYRASKNLVYIHGIYTNEYHAKKTVGAYHNSVLYGHTHDRQEYTEVSPIDAHKLYKGASCGCLCTRNPNYLRNKPNRWVNGFNYAYLDSKTGDFNDFFVYIIKNRFWANGHRYK